MTYTVRVLLDLQFTKYMTVEADSEEEAVAKVNDASASEAFFDEMTENYDHPGIWRWKVIFVNTITATLQGWKMFWPVTRRNICERFQ